MSIQSGMALLMVGLAWSGSAIADTGTLVVQIEGFRNDNGQAGITLYDKAEAFPTKPEAAVRSAWVEVKGHRATVEFADLPYGTYAVAAFHDENGNKKMDKNFLGIPKEGVAASNDAKGSMGPPKFADAKFTFDQARKTVSLRMGY